MSASLLDMHESAGSSMNIFLSVLLEYLPRGCETDARSTLSRGSPEREIGEVDAQPRAAPRHNSGAQESFSRCASAEVHPRGFLATIRWRLRVRSADRIDLSQARRQPPSYSSMRRLSTQDLLVAPIGSRSFSVRGL